MGWNYKQAAASISDLETDQNQDTKRMESHQLFLPDKIIIDILSRLPADSTLLCRRVCKAWRSIIDQDTVFLDMHIGRLTSSSSSSLGGFVTLESAKNCFSTEHYVQIAEYKRNDQEVLRFNKRWKLPFKDTTTEIHRSLTIVGSCNGLICILTIPDYDIINGSHYTFVCNPLTDEVVNLSGSSINSNGSTSTDHDQGQYYSTLSLEKIGFGYLPTTNEYKIVRIYTSGARRIRHVQVYTLGSGYGWRTIVPEISWSDISFVSSTRVSKLGVSVNGALYFNNRMDIVSFDMANEEFRIVVPPLPEPHCTDIDGLGVLGGCLCATKSRFSINNSTSSTMTNWVMETDLWVTEKEKDNREEEEYSWIKKFSLPSSGMFFSYIPLRGVLAPPRILLQTKWIKRIVSYNPETLKSCFSDFPSCEKPSKIIQIIPYVKSCVFLKTIGETV